MQVVLPFFGVSKWLQGAGEFLGALEAVTWLLGDGLGDNTRQFAWNRRVKAANVGRQFVQVPLENSACGLPGKDRLACQRLKEQDAQRVDVRARCRFAPLNLLRCQIRWRPNGQACARLVVCLEELTQAEVGQQEMG